MQTNGERLGRTDATVRMTVQEAAALGVTVEAVRGRMHRGHYGREKTEDGRVFVFVPADQLPADQPDRSSERSGERSTNGQANVRPNVGSGPAEQVVERLLDEVAFLRAELAERSDALRRPEELHGEEIRRRDHIIAGLVERVRETREIAPGEILDAEEPTPVTAVFTQPPVDAQEAAGRVDPPHMDGFDLTGDAHGASAGQRGSPAAAVEGHHRRVEGWTPFGFPRAVWSVT